MIFTIAEIATKSSKGKQQQQKITKHLQLKWPGQDASCDMSTGIIEGHYICVFTVLVISLVWVVSHKFHCIFRKKKIK